MPSKAHIDVEAWSFFEKYRYQQILINSFYKKEYIGKIFGSSTIRTQDNPALILEGHPISYETNRNAKSLVSQIRILPTYGHGELK